MNFIGFFLLNYTTKNKLFWFQTNKSISVVKEIIEDNYFKMILYNNDIIEIIWDTSISTINVDHLTRMRTVLAEFGGGKEMRVYYSTHDFLNISDDARKLASSEEFCKYTLANAVQIDSPAMKIVMNIFLRFNKPVKPTKGFSTRESAFEWLTNFQQD